MAVAKGSIALGQVSGIPAVGAHREGSADLVDGVRYADRHHHDFTGVRVAQSQRLFHGNFVERVDHVLHLVSFNAHSVGFDFNLNFPIFDALNSYQKLHGGCPLPRFVATPLHRVELTNSARNSGLRGGDWRAIAVG